MNLDPKLIAHKNHQILTSMGYTIPITLPTLEPFFSLNPQNNKSCARRVMVLTYIVGFGFGATPALLLKALNDFDLFQYCSKNESSLFKRTLSQQEATNCSWMTECIQAFAWSFGLAELDHHRYCDDDLSSKLPQPFVDPGAFISSAKLRPFDEIYQMADLHYRLHWQARDFRLKGTKSMLNEGVISERRKSLEWIIGSNENWDEISLDT